jgi:hypothetical protein
MALPDPNALVQRLIDKINNSRFFTISLGLHILLILVFGGTVMYQAVQEPPDFEGEGSGFVAAGEAVSAPQPTQMQPQQTNFTVTAPTTQSNPTTAITAMTATPLDFTMQSVIAPPVVAPTTVDAAAVAPAPAQVTGSGMTGADAAAIGAFSEGWGKGKVSGSGTGVRKREFEFIAFLARYEGGNWNSTVQVRNDQVVRGSLPNLLYYMSKVSANKIKTNERNVKVIKLDSDELFTAKPPFIFMTGTRDFKLTEKEVENLRKYVRMGGAIWGDSSVPGQRSRFDIAFRREMKRVIPDVDKNFEPLPPNHPLFTKAYFPEITQAPPGLNFYAEPVYALKIFDEVAIIYTANDYGDMMQIGLTPDNQIDLGRDASGNYVATNLSIWQNRDIYMNNLTEESVQRSYEFGINLVVHLLTRWEDKVKSAPRL